MKIGFLENLPVLQEKLEKDLKNLPFRKELVLESAREEGDYDLLLCDKNYLPASLPFQSKIFLVPGSARVPVLPEKGIFLTGGMNREDAVSFSSIGENCAFLCLEKEIFLPKKSILPFEQKIPFDRNYSLYKNLATGFAKILVTLIFTEEL